MIHVRACLYILVENLLHGRLEKFSRKDFRLSSLLNLYFFVVFKGMTKILMTYFYSFLLQ